MPKDVRWQLLSASSGAAQNSPEGAAFIPGCSATFPARPG
jgi:hypothetical protein